MILSIINIKNYAISLNPILLLNYLQKSVTKPIELVHQLLVLVSQIL